MTNRREFLAGSLAALAPALAGTAAPHVEASASLFHGHPDGHTTLVRFTVSGVDAPAARLRVLAANGRLLGTAGLVRRGELLVGELWLPLTAPLAVRSDLETPVTRGVHRTSHRLVPTPRWTIRWLTLAEPGELRARIARVPPLLRGAEAAVLSAAGVRLNPWSAPPERGRDHLDLLRVAAPAARLRAETGLALSARAWIPRAERGEPFVDRALAGSGVEGVIDDGVAGDPAALGFDGGRVRMVPRLEAWLAALGTDDGTLAVTVIGTDPDFAVRARHTVEEWNGLYAYPRILIGQAAHSASASPQSAPPPPPPLREAGPFAPFAHLASPRDPTLAGVARRFALPVGGALVFNPSPFGRSDLVAGPDGAPRLATDVPGLGYAYLPDAAEPGPAAAREALHAVVTERFAVRLDEGTGDIVSLVERARGRELAAPGGALNALDGAVVTDAWVERYAGLGARLVARRMTPAGAVTSKVTAYDALPWVDVENAPDADAAGAFDWRFDLQHVTGAVLREAAGGVVRAPAPVDRAPLLRWLALSGAPDTVFFGSGTPGAVSVSLGAQVIAHSPAGAARFRLALHAGHLLPDDPWRFGFGMMPLVSVAAPGGGDLALPTFGRLVDVADPGVALVGLKPADDGLGLVLYLMDLGGPARDIPIRPGALTFDGAVRTDLTERDLEPAAELAGGGVTVPIPALGYAAVRLLGVRLAG